MIANLTGVVRKTMLASALMISVPGFSSDSFFSLLKNGEMVNLNKSGEKFEIDKIPGGGAYKIVRMAQDYIDLSMGVQVKRIPVSSILSINVVSFPR